MMNEVGDIENSYIHVDRRLYNDEELLLNLSQELFNDAGKQRETSVFLEEYYGDQLFQYGPHRGTISDIVSLCPPIKLMLDKGPDAIIAWVNDYKLIEGPEPNRSLDQGQEKINIQEPETNLAAPNIDPQEAALITKDSSPLSPKTLKRVDTSENKIAPILHSEVTSRHDSITAPKVIAKKQDSPISAVKNLSIVEIKDQHQRILEREEAAQVVAAVFGETLETNNAPVKKEVTVIKIPLIENTFLNVLPESPMRPQIMPLPIQALKEDNAKTVTEPSLDTTSKKVEVPLAMIVRPNLKLESESPKSIPITSNIDDITDLNAAHPHVADKITDFLASSIESRIIQCDLGPLQLAKADALDLGQSLNQIDRFAVDNTETPDHIHALNAMLATNQDSHFLKKSNSFDDIYQFSIPQDNTNTELELSIETPAQKDFIDKIPLEITITRLIETIDTTDSITSKIPFQLEYMEPETYAEIEAARLLDSVQPLVLLSEVESVRFVIEQLRTAANKDDCELYVKEVIHELTSLLLKLGYKNPNVIIQEFLKYNSLQDLHNFIELLEVSLRASIERNHYYTHLPSKKKNIVQIGMGRLAMKLINTLRPLYLAI